MKNKITLVFISFCVFFSIILSRAFYIQVYKNNHYLEKAKKQIFRTAKIYPRRGNIYERNGSPLAINVKTYNIFTMPKEVNGNRTYRKLSKIVPRLSYSLLKKKVRNRTRYTWLARKIVLDKNQVNKINKIKGIYIEKAFKRIYPNHELLSQTIGFVGIDNTGLDGLEYHYDKKLRGQAIVIKYLKDARGKLITYKGIGKGSASEDIHLSIDKEIQSVAEKELKKAIVKNKAVKGGIGVMDAISGEILAIANYPTFDPNKVHLSRPEDRKLSFVTDPIEPGSTFKAVTIASALEHKMATPKTRYYCEKGRFRVDNHYISEAGGNKKLEWLSLNEIMKYSSNIGTTKIAFDLTFSRLRKTMESFGIGKKTGIELPGESRGIIPQRKTISPLNLSNISFGQGVATTGIQMLSIFATIANDGLWMKPTLIRGQNKNKKGIRIISKTTARNLTRMLIDTVKEGTGTNAQIPYFSIAGKTGTAQRLKNGVYDGYIPGFIGYPVNVKNPFVVYIYIEDPQGEEYYGNSIAAPVFKKVAQYILYKTKDFNKLALDQSDFHDIIRTKSSSSRIFKKNIIPDFSGLDKMSSKKLAKKIGLSLSFKGMGIVASQNPKAGSIIEKDKKVELIYNPPEYE